METFSQINSEIENQNINESLEPEIYKKDSFVHEEAKKETSEQRKSLLESKRNEILEMFDDKKDSNIEKKDSKKEGVDFVFEQNPELSKIGTKEQYSEYLDGVFPESKIKNIVYHGTTSDFDEFNIEHFNSNSGSRDREDPAFYFTSKNIVAKDFLFNQDGKILPVLLDIKNPEVINGQHKNLIVKRGVTKLIDIPAFKNNNRDGFIINDVLDVDPKASLKRVIDGVGNKDYYSDIYAIFENNQSFVLGSKRDLENFKKFIENHLETQS